MTERHTNGGDGTMRTSIGTRSGGLQLPDTDFPNLPGAACKDVTDPDRFYAFEPRQIEQARNICRRCPAIRECLAWALTHTEHGVWAATTAEERAELLSRHRRTA